MKRRGMTILGAAVAVASLALGGCATNRGLSAEEYFAIGMAYFEIGQNRAANRAHYFTEAERWLSRARSQDRTMMASAYNLGLLSFEMGRFGEAARQFESILAHDPYNTLALRAAAYTRIRMGEFEAASLLYERFLALVPESADDGFNHALVLFAMERYADAEAVLRRNELALFENADFLLLYARSQGRQDKPEAIDSYAAWLTRYAGGGGGAVPVGTVRFEFAEVLEGRGLYARALEEFRAAQGEITAAAENPSRADARFGVARVLLVADPANPEGIAELRGAVEGGFADFDAMDALLEDDRISGDVIYEARAIVAGARRAAEGLADETDAALDAEPYAGAEGLTLEAAADYEEGE